MPSAEVSLEDALLIARQQWRAGNLVVAERAYRDILNSIPGHLEARHELGIVCYQRGKRHEGYQMLREVAAETPDNAIHLNNFAIVALEYGRREEAIDAWRRAIALDETYADALSNLANAITQDGSDDGAEEAMALCRRALAARPEHANAALNLGLAQQARGDLAAAVATWEDLVAREPRHAKAFANLSQAYRDLGRAEDALAAARRAVELDDRLSMAHNNLGNALLQQGDVAGAEAAFRRAVDLDPKNRDAANNLGIALQLQHRYEEAARQHRYAQVLEPDDPRPHGQLSIALREQGDIAGAEAAAQQAIALAPETAEFHLVLAELLLISDRSDEAEAVLQEAIALQPDSARVYLRLSDALSRLNRSEEAVAAARKAIELQPETPWPYHTLSRVLFWAGDVEEAERVGCQAVESHPEFGTGHVWLAEMYQTLGRMTDSDAHARKALEIAPNLVGAYHAIANAKRFAPGDPDLAEMERLNASLTLPSLRAPLAFALGKAYEDIGEDDKAFAAYKEGNDIRRRLLVFNTQGARENVAMTKSLYTRELIEQLAGVGDPSEVPVFIVGMPRSGTTLTEQIIASHPDVHGAGELPTLGVVAKPVRELTPEALAEAGRAYVERVRALAPEAKRITDKMPGNYAQLGFIALALPNARIIHCRRDPVDTCFSCYKQNFARGQHWSYDLTELGERYRLYRELIAHWEAVLPGRILHVDYEETIADTEGVARRLIDFVGLPWDDRCLDFHRAERPVMTASKTQVRQPIYKSSVRRWHRFASHLAPLIAALGDVVGETTRELDVPNR